MLRPRNPRVSISIRKGALEAIYHECDQFDRDETGGRLIGRYQKKGADYDIEVLDVIGPGPNAIRTPTSFFQDGEYQEGIFRSIEERYPEIEHLGNWHTHHVNGLSTLSAGDEATYRAIVNHGQHNTDFFYALLIVQKTPGREPPYSVKHYFLRRNEDTISEIPDSQVRIVDKPVPREVSAPAVLPSVGTVPAGRHWGDANLERVKDQEFFSEFYLNLRPVFSKSLGAFCWKGTLQLIDGSHAEVLAVEHSNAGEPFYSILLTGQSFRLWEGFASCGDHRFKSARHAVLYLERDMNRELYRNKREQRDERHHG